MKCSEHIEKGRQYAIRARARLIGRMSARGAALNTSSILLHFLPRRFRRKHERQSPLKRPLKKPEEAGLLSGS